METFWWRGVLSALIRLGSGVSVIDCYPCATLGYSQSVGTTILTELMTAGVRYDTQITSHSSAGTFKTLQVC